MGTAIIYHTRYGTTQHIAKELAAGFGDDTEIRSCSKADAALITKNTRIIIGGPIYGGKISAKLIRICEHYKSILLRQTVGLFISCMYQDERAHNQLIDTFPGWLVAHACYSDWLGGRVILDDLGLVDRITAVRFAGLKKNMDRMQPDRIRTYIEKFPTD